MLFAFFLLIRRRPPRYTLCSTRFPSTSLFLSPRLVRHLYPRRRRAAGARLHRRPALPGAAPAPRRHRGLERRRTRRPGHPRLHDRRDAAEVTALLAPTASRFLRHGRVIQLGGAAVGVAVAAA